MLWIIFFLFYYFHQYNGTYIELHSSSGLGWMYGSKTHTHTHSDISNPRGSCRMASFDKLLSDKHTHPCSLTLDFNFLMHKVPLKKEKEKKELTFFPDSSHFCNVTMSGPGKTTASREWWLFQMPLFLCQDGH